MIWGFVSTIFEPKESGSGDKITHVQGHPGSIVDWGDAIKITGNHGFVPLNMGFSCKFSPRTNPLIGKSKNMTSSVGMMIIPNCFWKVIIHSMVPVTTNQWFIDDLGTQHFQTNPNKMTLPIRMPGPIRIMIGVHVIIVVNFAPYEWLKHI